jgi:hypothetical protein
MAVPPLPKTFDCTPFLNQWLRWSRVYKCFKPGAGQRAVKVDPELAPARQRGGVYLFRWSMKPTPRVVHTDRAVIYVGETSDFCGRMLGWARSAGFLGERERGHSAAYRWREGSEHLWVAFFQMPVLEDRRLAKHVRLYFEIMATEEYRATHGRLPRVNEWESADET